MDSPFHMWLLANTDNGNKVLATISNVRNGTLSETRATTAQITKHPTDKRLTKRPADPGKRGDSQLASFMEKRLAFCESLERKKHPQFRVVTQPSEAFG